MTIEAEVANTEQFGSWRKAVRNMFDYERRSSKWWREVGMWIWLSQDGSVRGIVTLGSLTEEEFIAAFDHRWPTTIQPIEECLLREHIYYAMRPEVVATTWPQQRRYQPVSAAVQPQGSVRSRRLTWEIAKASGCDNDAMPVLL